MALYILYIFKWVFVNYQTQPVVSDKVLKVKKNIFL